MTKLLVDTRIGYSNVVCGSSMRSGGASRAQYCGLNLGSHVGDRISNVTFNRALFFKCLEQRFGKLQPPIYLNQRHSNHIKRYEDILSNTEVLDAIWTDNSFTPLVIMTADCLPILLTDGERICAVHAGWRGLTGDLLEKSVSVFSNPDRVNASIGPYIHQPNYEVGFEVTEHFSAIPDAIKFTDMDQKALLDLGVIAKTKLAECGVTKVIDMGICTYSDHRFYSHRRASHQGLTDTGRMVSFIIKLENK
ncbi:MAG: peptidoglycan editing factor PgeF [Pseudomonadota bacterium]